ncbi:hypothetical protein D3C83_214760 [compost metagenome]
MITALPTGGGALVPVSIWLNALCSGEPSGKLPDHATYQRLLFLSTRVTVVLSWLFFLFNTAPWSSTVCSKPA